MVVAAPERCIYAPGLSWRLKPSLSEDVQMLLHAVSGSMMKVGVPQHLSLHQSPTTIEEPPSAVDKEESEEEDENAIVGIVFKNRKLDCVKIGDEVVEESVWQRSGVISYYVQTCLKHGQSGAGNLPFAHNDVMLWVVFTPEPRHHPLTLCTILEVCSCIYLQHRDLNVFRHHTMSVVHSKPPCVSYTRQRL